MTPLPKDVSDSQLIAFIDQWASLMEREDYEAAFNFTAHIETMGWTPVLIEEVVKAYGDAEPTQKVTLIGAPTDIVQRKKVSRWPTNKYGFFGEIWYDLNIDGKASDLTATFGLKWADSGITVHLDDIHVH